MKYNIFEDPGLVLIYFMAPEWSNPLVKPMILSIFDEKVVPEADSIKLIKNFKKTFNSLLSLIHFMKSAGNPFREPENVAKPL